MKVAAALLFMLLLRPWPLAQSERDIFALWNIGQGSWATRVSYSGCLHFDMGGERGRWPGQAINICTQTSNRLYLSHLDWDHISNINLWRKKVRHFCLMQRSKDINLRTTSPAKRQLIKNIEVCENSSQGHLAHTGVREVAFIQPASWQKANALSRIYIYDHFLLPGDSTTSAEKIWASRLEARASLSPKMLEPQVLILGHHGSRTSTSENLLYHLPSLKLAVASARSAKYGHPHKEVIQRLFARKIPLLTTEKWGHLLFEL